MTLLLSITQFKNSTKRALSIHNVHTHKNKTLRNSFFFVFVFFFGRLRELHTLKGHVESVVKLKGLDIETIQQHYTV